MLLNCHLSVRFLIEATLAHVTWASRSIAKPSSCVAHPFADHAGERLAGRKYLACFGHKRAFGRVLVFVAKGQNQKS